MTSWLTFSIACLRCLGGLTLKPIQSCYDELGKRLQSCFPLVHDKPRKEFISSGTWQLVRDKHSLRKRLRYMHGAVGRQILARAFAVWRLSRDCAHFEHGHGQCDYRSFNSRMHVRRLACARVVKELQRVIARLKTALAQDEAQFTRHVFESAEAAGPDEIAKLLRAVLKQGRKFKAPRTAPVFIGHGGETIVDLTETTEMLAQHFATAERGTKQSVQTVQSNLRVVRACEGQVDEVGCIPSLAELAQACRSLQNGRAPGLRGIPAKALKQASTPAARTLYPVLLKIFCCGECPLDWRRVLTVAIPKKGYGTPAAWRAIALQEPAMKASGKAARKKLMEYFTPGFGIAQGGAAPGVGMELPQALVKTHCRRLRQEKVSGGVVYFDGIAAFHSAIRQFLCDGHFNAEDNSGLLDLLDFCCSLWTFDSLGVWCPSHTS